MTRKRWQIAQYFEIRWWKHYLGGKDVNAYLQWKRHYWQQFLDRIHLPISDRSSVSVLDAGCGPAGIFIHFSQAKVTAIDPLMEQYQGLSHFNTDWYENTTFHKASLEFFQSATPYHYVFCLNAINHVADLQRAVANLYRLTKTGGLCVISTDAHKYRLARKILKAIPLDILHPHQFNMDEYAAIFKRTGFRIRMQELVKKGKLFDYRVFVLEK